MIIISLDNGKTYLADGIENDFIKKAVEIDEFDKKELVKYFKKKNLREDIDIQLSSNTGYTSTKLTEEQEKEYNRIYEIFEEATEKAVAYTINSVFDKLVGKYGN